MHVVPRQNVVKDYFFFPRKVLNNDSSNISFYNKIRTAFEKIVKVLNEKSYLFQRNPLKKVYNPYR